MEKDIRGGRIEKERDRNRDRHRDQKVKMEAILSVRKRQTYCSKVNCLQWIRSSVLAANFANPFNIWLAKTLCICMWECHYRPAYTYIYLSVSLCSCGKAMWVHIWEFIHLCMYMLYYVSACCHNCFQGNIS